MMKRYNPLEIEQKWQKIWEEGEAFKAEDGDDGREKIFLAEMFPYPSGAGLHVGHVRNFSIVDTLARFYTQRGYNVLRPFGYDTFGLPAENYAIKTGVSPKVATEVNIKNFRKQLKRLGFAIDWSREINTSDPEYYRWTQWCFLQLFKRGLAYRKESYQWWCPVDKTVLANEQVENGHCWRCGTEVEKKKMRQWFFKITEYADELLEDIEGLDWPEKIKVAQRNWIGRSEGHIVGFKVVKDAMVSSPVSCQPAVAGATHLLLGRNLRDAPSTIDVFTTRVDTIYGVTFLVLAPEHKMVKELVNENTRAEVEEYVRSALKKSEIERQENKEKTGVFTGSYAINPMTGEKIPVWVADYVLGGYGTGAIMAVPDGDERDREFAEKFGLPIVKLTKFPSEAEIEKLGEKKAMYKMRDWLISRQRYWGCPIPIAYDKNGEPHAIPEDQLPVLLPDLDDFKPDESGRSALAKAEDWLKVEIDGEEMTRETDTLDGYACSSWYLWRYVSPRDSREAWDPALIGKWGATDVYCGGDHAVAHLLYIRFWAKFFADQGKLPFREPVKKLLYNGYINAPDGKKMSKSKGNVIDPLDVIDSGYGADTLRTYELFIGPYNEDAAWSTKAIGGVYRFLNRCHNLVFDENLIKNKDDKNEIIRHKTIKKVTEDIERASFNTAVAALMEFVNELYKNGASEEDLTVLGKLLKPFAPHLASEILSALKKDDKWPEFDEGKLVSDTVEVVVQVNGKLRAKLNVGVEMLEKEEELVRLALEDENVRKFVPGEPKKTIFVAKARLVNLVV